MEEVDKIILDSLRNINCDIGDVTSLKEFDSYLSVLAISSCLEAILPEIEIPKKLPPSMSARMKMASTFSDHVKMLGFHGDMSYSTVLYGSELEIRKLLMFLIERIPRESLKANVGVEGSYMQSFLKQIDENVQLHTKHLWMPSSLLNKGFREYDGKQYSIHSFGNSVPLISKPIKFYKSNQSEDEKEYFNHIVPEVTKQCAAKYLIPSLLFKNSQFPENFVLSDNNTEQKSVIDKDDKNQIENILYTHELTLNSSNTSNSDNSVQQLVKEVNDLSQKYICLKETITKVQFEIEKIERMNTEEQCKLDDALAKVKLKTKTFAVMSNDENIGKLKAMIKRANERFAELTVQWNDVKTPLLKEYDSLQNSLSIKESEYREEYSKLTKLRETYNKMNKDFKEKKVLEEVLIQKYQQVPKTDKRSTYTSRIYEIIGNIKKQNIEIQKILNDTRALQKEIKNLTEQIDRSFTLADELLFHDAKQEDTARKSYKLLASLRDEFSTILGDVSDVGQIERECRNLQEQIDAEKAKEIGAKLERVESDILQIETECESLINSSQKRI